MSTSPRSDLVLIRIHTTAGATRPVRFSGEVEAVGADVVGIVPGDLVRGTTDHVFGQYVCVPQRRLETTEEEN